MRLADLRDQASSRWAARLPLVVALGLVALAVGRFVATPLIALDGDLWYHLAHGESILRSGRLPSTTEFSFLAPHHQWIDYYWMFQLLVAGVQRVAGFEGLIALRAVCFCALLLLVLDALLPRASTGFQRWLAAALLGCYLVVLVPRELNLRPHVLTYACEALFALVLIKRRSWLGWLPLVAVAWINLHGVTFPVLLVFCLAFLADAIRERMVPGAERASPGRAWSLLAIAGCALAVLATPHGRGLLRVPFVSTRLASQDLAELLPVDWAGALRFDFSRLLLEPSAAFALVAVAAMVGIAVDPRRLLMRPGILVVAAAGLALLLRGDRFQVDAVLLFLPLAASCVESVRGLRRSPALALAITAVLLLATSFAWRVIPGRQWGHPVSQLNLPIGSARYLERDPAGGRVMNHPHFGGYLLWALRDRFTISMDMETPFVFDDVDRYLSKGFFADPALFDRVLAQFRPTYLLAPIDAPVFAGLVRSRAPRYQPVFFDDASVLYVDLEQRPHAAVIEVVDPWALSDRRVPELDPQVAGAMLAELAEVLAVHPTNDLAHRRAAVLLARSGDFASSERHARATIATTPGHSEGHLLLGNALLGAGRLDEAIEAYREAIDLAIGSDAIEDARSVLGRVYLAKGELERAYALLVKGRRFTDPVQSPADLEALGGLCLAVGDHTLGRALLEFALLRLEPDDVEGRARIERALAEGDQGH